MTAVPGNGVLTVAIPVKNGGALLGEVLSAVRRQRLSAGTELELLVCDSGSTDGSQRMARRHGARLLEIPPEQFNHGATRNLLAEHSLGTHIAFITQDATPAGEDWLATLAGAFERAPDVAMAFGPYTPRPDASPMVRRELTAFFASFAPDGEARVDRAEPGTTSAAPVIGPAAFFTDANAMISRAAWAQVPFRTIAYAEDHALAHDMLAAGFAKVYEPRAAVLHSHEYSLRGWYRRAFEENRAIGELYGYVEPIAPKTALLKLWGLVGADWRWAGEHAPTSQRRSPWLLPRATLHHAARITGAAAGSRAGVRNKPPTHPSLPSGRCQ